jgi:L-amino acid N-acyltransferase YncA
MLIFQTERWTDVEHEIRGLTSEHWEMLALNKDTVPLDPDWDIYRASDSTGRLHVLTARAENQVLAGYYVSFIMPHPHYKSTRFGMVDSYYMRPEFRTPTAGLEFFLALEEEMRKCDVKCLITTTKLHHDISLLLERLGWQPAGKTLTKVLE